MMTNGLSIMNDEWESLVLWGAVVAYLKEICQNSLVGPEGNQEIRQSRIRRSYPLNSR